jgi:hypothetical protein
MNKTINPKEYLKSAEKAFEAFKNKGIHVGCNFILGYPGENGQTLSETLKFLLNNKGYIDSLWGGSLIEYPGSPLVKQMDNFNKQFGTKREVLSPYSEMLESYPISPSYAFNFQQMSLLSTIIMKLFNTRTTFYEHYKWYPGLVGNNATLLDEKSFYQLFLNNVERVEELGFDITRDYNV